MARLLEIKNDPLGIGISVDNGALLNFKALHEQNGIIEGCELNNVDGSIYIGEGTLSIQGFRIQFTGSEKVFDMINFQTTQNGDFKAIVRIEYDATLNNAVYAFDATPAQNTLKQDKIQNKITGIYEYPIACFIKSGTSISNFKSLLTQINVNKDDLDYQTIEL